VEQRPKKKSKKKSKTRRIEKEPSEVPSDEEEVEDEVIDEQSASQRYEELQQNILAAKAELKKMQAAEELEKQIQALQARRAAIVRGDIPPADAEVLEAHRSSDSKLAASRPKKRKRDVSSSEFEITSSSDESDLTSSESESSTDSDSSSSSGSSRSRRRRKKKSKKKKGKLRVKDVLANWRRQARRMPAHGKDQMVQLLRLLKKQRRTISKRALASYVEELHYLYNKSTRGKLVADQYKINQAAKTTKDSAGLLDMKDVMSAQKQVEALKVLQDSKNDGGLEKARPGRSKKRPEWSKKAERQQLNANGSGPCFKCKLPGHIASACPTSKPPTK
jgi:hypothetical protein